MWRAHGPPANVSSIGLPLIAETSYQECQGKLGCPCCRIAYTSSCQNRCGNRRNILSNTPMPSRSIGPATVSGSAGTKSIAPALSTPSGTVTTTRAAANDSDSVSTRTPASDQATDDTVCSSLTSSPAARELGSASYPP